MNENSNLSNIRHSLAHLLASAVLEIYPGTKNTIGPAIENGFYYDFEFKNPITESDLEKIEQKMREQIKSWKKFDHKEVTEEEAKEIFRDNKYKLELIEDIIKKGEKITLYTSGNFTDLCRGGHVDDISDMKNSAYKLSHIAGAYWKGDEKNVMLTRIYGLAFENQSTLDKYLNDLDEAKKRDHKKLGKELGLFTISPLVGSGLPLFQPKGMIIRKSIEDFLWDLHKNHGYSRVWTPHITKEDLYIKSGHAEKFGDELFKVQGKEEKFYLKPMNCPHHMQIFTDNQFSYKQMPVRYFEPATVYRDEKSGQLGGLTRVRSITQDDGHLFCRTIQIESEVGKIVSIIKKFYTVFGMSENYWVSLSVRGQDKSQYLGTNEVWETAENALEKAAKENSLPYKRVEGEAAFYGPKLDFIFKDSLGRNWQLATIQCDFNLPERFDLSFTNEKGEKERPVVIHRAISGALERFIGILIEHYGGNFPLWLSPIQVRVLTVRESHAKYAHDIFEKIQNEGIRVEIDDSDDGFGKKIRKSKVDRVSYTIIVGDKDIEANKVTLESRDEGALGQMSLHEVIEKLNKLIKDKA